MNISAVARTSKALRRASYFHVAALSAGLLIFIMTFLVPGVSLAGQSTTSADTSEGPPFIAQGQLVFIKHGTGDVITMITIQIADNDQQRAEGLMWRKYMPENRGMLFIFDDQEILTFWMKNTYIPLDMIFADKSGRIVSIHRNATPLNETSISSIEPAEYVVEVNAGFCSRYGIKAGDKIEFER